MTLSARLRNEYSKMRHLQIGLIACLLMVGVLALALFSAVGSDLLTRLEDPDGYGWKLLLLSLHSAVMFTAPVLLAVMAGRQTEIEHSGNGWPASATAGVAPGRLCRAKLLALGTLVTPMPLIWGGAILVLGRAVGITAPFPTSRALGLIISLMVVDLAVLALQLLLSARTENQLLPLGAALGGVLLGVFGQVLPRWLLHLSPWTYYTLIAPAGFVGLDLVYLGPAGPGTAGMANLPGTAGLPSTASLAVVGGALFLGATARLDRWEA